MTAVRPLHVAGSFAFLLAAAAVLAACGSSGGSSSTPAASVTPAPTAASTADGTASATSITATETEFAIALSRTAFTPGTYTIVVKNNGSVTHALTVDGPGVDDMSTRSIDPGKSATLTVTLAAGSYEIFCPVGNHKMLGMDDHVTVS